MQRSSLPTGRCCRSCSWQRCPGKKK
jgi:hypothetical protein